MNVLLCKIHTHWYNVIKYTLCNIKQTYILKYAHQSLNKFCCKNFSYFILGSLVSDINVRSKGSKGREVENRVQQMLWNAFCFTGRWTSASMPYLISPFTPAWTISPKEIYKYHVLDLKFLIPPIPIHISNQHFPWDNFSPRTHLKKPIKVFHIPPLTLIGLEVSPSFSPPYSFCGHRYYNP